MQVLPTLLYPSSSAFDGLEESPLPPALTHASQGIWAQASHCGDATAVAAMLG